MYPCNGFAGLPRLRAETLNKVITDSGHFRVQARSSAKAESLAMPRALVGIP